MQYAIQIGLTAVGVLSLLIHALPGKADTIKVSQQESNDSLAQVVSRTSARNTLSLNGTVGGSRPVSSTSFPSRVIPIDGKDLYQVTLPEQQTGFATSFALVSDSTTRMKVWADRNNDRNIAGDALVLEVAARQIGRKALPAGVYIVEIIKASAPAIASNYAVEISNARVCPSARLC